MSSDLYLIREGATPTRKGGILMPEFTTGRRAHRAYNWRVWWIPQVGSGITPFFIECPTPEFALRTIEVLAEYDLYQLRENVKPDYSNAGGIQRWEDQTGEWEDVEYDEDERDWV